ncbi:hypothetical protein KORDIASMS9_03810 [Kordia sp. SMS9]|uniref:hypothetical protein n=1 Tax=Kordia sp. SMS9 TaxID=2282170 RepID=UPI000E0CC176|nr:hypothetical protein [Kordia sp. SMS9]AXG71553.1 hypothetical protein KORDIASMS9_03810 [Kordia sp. SMS9]
MDKKVWHKDKSMMHLINASSSKVLALADGKKPFSKLVNESLVGTDIEITNTKTLESFNLETELNDRFLQVTTFCISMWECEILNFRLSKENPENITISPILKEIVDSEGNFTVRDAYSIIAKETKENEYKMYNRLKGNLAMLLAYDMLFIEFTGSIEDSEESNIIDNDLPQYKVGYMKPEFLKDPHDLGGDIVTRIHPALVAIAGGFAADAVKVAAEEAGTTAGDIVGRMESR